MALELDRLLHTRSFVPSEQHDLSAPTKSELLAFRAIIARYADPAFGISHQADCEGLLEDVGWLPGIGN